MIWKIQREMNWVPFYFKWFENEFVFVTEVSKFLKMHKNISGCSRIFSASMLMLRVDDNFTDCISFSYLTVKPTLEHQCIFLLGDLISD